MKVDLKQYEHFVAAVTSSESHELAGFVNRLERLDSHWHCEDDEYVNGPDINVPLLLCGAIGLGSEAGELQEIVKKLLFQGKPLSEETVFHMKRELGDIMWYWINACRALNLDPNEVIAENVRKLQSRYPGGEFDVYHSENRKQGDL